MISPGQVAITLRPAGAGRVAAGRLGNRARWGNPDWVLNPAGYRRA